MSFKNNGAGIFLIIILMLFASLLCDIKISAAASFNDVAQDHWAYEAIDKLVQNGYMDGFADDTFRGRKVITRYELALILAKILTKVEDVETSGGIISPKDAETIKKLAAEFKDELNTLGVKINSLDQRVTEIEKAQKKAEKFRLAGYYKTSQTFVWDRLTTKDDDDNGDDDDDYADKNGLGDMVHRVNLKITGRPYDDVEAYLETESYINKKTADTKSYSKSVLRPYLNKYLSDYKNERGVIAKKGHLTLKSQYANIRTFSGEDMTKLDDPVIMLNKGGDHARDGRTSAVYSGIETKGTVSDFTYNINVLKDYSEKIYDDGKTYNDIYAARGIYVAPKDLLKSDNAELTVGTSFVEKAYGYSTYGNFSEGNGVDLSLKFTDKGTVKLTTEYMESRNGNSDKKIVRDDGTKLDLEYQLENLTLILNHYKYGKDFFIATARKESLFTDYDDGDDDMKNYGHKTVDGENLLKMTMKYDMLFGDDQKLKLEGIIQTKKWESDPANPWQTDGYTGQKFSFEANADMAKDMTSKIYTSLKKDALKDEVGTYYTEVEMNAKLNDRISSTARFGTGNDVDDTNKEGKTNKSNKFYGELSSQLLKNIWGKVFGEREIKRLGWNDGNTASPSNDNTEMLTDITGLETNFTLTPSMTLKLSTKSQQDSYSSFNDKNQKINWFISELNQVFTDKLKGRVQYWWKNPKAHDETSNDNLRNLTAELIYEATDRTRMFVRYGDWIEEKRDDKNYETEKKVTFEATTDF
ncbi:MAG: S-layer homology domain-containing protein [Candidatus Wallbacteria bacterium]